MTRICYVNGKYVSALEAVVPMEDRGHNFADGVYEVAAFYNRRFLDEALHLKRLERSLKETRIAPPISMKALRLVMRELVERNNRDNGILYLQITRGAAKRDHPFPVHVRPSLCMAVYASKPPKASEVEKGVAVITAPDERWKRCDIKSISLLPNVLAKQKAVEAGVRETWLLLEDGTVTEGTSTNAYMVNAKGELITHPLGPRILGGITRDVVLELARGLKIKVIERPFKLNELLKAKEAFLTSTSANVLPVVKVDGKTIGSGKPGEISKKLLQACYAHIARKTGYAWQ